MNEFRSAVRNGHVVRLVASGPARERCRRRAVRSLSGLLIPRTERRTADQRREARFQGVFDRATIGFRRKRILVKVINVSRGGLMIEGPINPRIGEPLSVEFDGYEPLMGAVCWVRDGRIGIDVGEGAIRID